MSAPLNTEEKCNLSWTSPHCNGMGLSAPLDCSTSSSPNTIDAADAIPHHRPMKVPPGAIDCDIHPAVPSTAALLPYLPDYWRDQFLNRHIDRYPFTLDELSAERAGELPAGLAAGDGTCPAAMSRRCVGRRSTPSAPAFAICNVLHGAIALFNEDMAAALCAAVNDWTAQELLDRDPRLRGSILLPIQNPDLAVKEIERLAPDRRFVQAPDAGHGRRACRQSALLADLSGGRTPRTPDCAPRRQHLSHRAHLLGLAVLSGRGLCGEQRGVRERADQLHRRGRVSAISRD